MDDIVREFRDRLRLGHCIRCGSAFYTSSPKRIYCNDACRQAAYRAAKRDA